MSLERIYLESFESEGLPRQEESAEFKRGFAAGRQAEQTEQAATTSRSLAELSSTLSDMSFGFEEARAYLAGRLHHLLVQLAEAALPSILHESFGAHLNEVIEGHFASLADQPVQITVTPDMAAALTAGHAGTNPRFHFIADKSLNEGQALLSDGATQLMLDLPSLLEALQSTLASFDSLERNEKHG